MSKDLRGDQCICQPLRTITDYSTRRSSDECNFAVEFHHAYSVRDSAGIKGVY